MVSKTEFKNAWFAHIEALNRFAFSLREEADYEKFKTLKLEIKDLVVKAAANLKNQS